MNTNQLTAFIICNLCVCTFCVCTFCITAEPGRGDNMARGKPYSLSPAPSYRYCTDPGDRTQLTDGVYTEGYFWTQKTTVGWQNANPVKITIDLGRVEPIREISFNTAAGVAGVTWPGAIFIFTSDDGRAYRFAGDLVALSAAVQPPPGGGYAIHRFRADGLRARGRHVMLLVGSTGPYTFVDEIEIGRGDPGWLAGPPAGRPVSSPEEFFENARVTMAARRRLRTDLGRVRDLAKKTPGAGPEVAAEIEAIAREIPRQEVEPGFRAVLPLNPLHRRIFSINARLLLARGIGAPGELLSWSGNPWDWLDCLQVPEKRTPARVRIAAARGAVRAGAFQLLFTGEEEAPAAIHLEGLPGTPVPTCLTLHRVVWTDTRQGVPVAAALRPAERAGNRYIIPLVPGMVQQIWLRLGADRIEPGRHRGALVIEQAAAKPLRVPLELEVYPVRLPRPGLHVGGWDYTDGTGRYGVTAENRELLVRHLRERHVDSPWATSAVLPPGRFDGEGKLVEAPGTGRLDAWIELWPRARQYCVFASVGGAFAGSPMGTPLFSRKVGAWISFWVSHLRKRGISPDRLALLLVDEPHESSQVERIAAWARAVRAAEPEVVIWEDPTYRDPRKALPALWEASDVLCPNRPMMMAGGERFEKFYRDLGNQGKGLSLYSCSGPTRLLDPYAYYRLQAWDCFRLGAMGTYFWALADTGGGSSWNEYANERTSYAPLFLDGSTVTAGKHMEAIFESAQDHACLELLARRVKELGEGKRTAPEKLLREAERLLEDAPSRVLNAPGARDLDWRKEKDRSPADRVRREILALLSRLDGKAKH